MSVLDDPALSSDLGPDLATTASWSDWGRALTAGSGAIPQAMLGLVHPLLDPEGQQTLAAVQGELNLMVDDQLQGMSTEGFGQYTSTFTGDSNNIFDAGLVRSLALKGMATLPPLALTVLLEVAIQVSRLNDRRKARRAALEDVPDDQAAPIGAAEDVGAPDAVDLLQPRGQDVLGAAAQGVEVLVPGQGEEDHREVGDGAREGRGLRLLRQLRPQVGDHAVHLGPGPVQVCAVGELQLDRVEAGLRRGPRGFEPLHGLQGRLEGLAHLRVHDLGGRPRVERRDGDDGQLERGDQLPFELPGGEDAEHRDEHGDERHERPPAE